MTSLIEEYLRGVTEKKNKLMVKTVVNEKGRLMKSTEKMPVLFLGHGSPMNAIEVNRFVRQWREVGQSLPKPDAILCISAHWETRGTFVTAMDEPATIHDFGGFPQELFDVQYPAPGSNALARMIREIITKTGVGLNYTWGLDHGAWTVLKHLYPEAEVPVIQLSLDYDQPPQYHYELAGELSPLREKGVLIIGSGNMIHNLGMLAWDRLDDNEYSFNWAAEAKEKMKNCILSGDLLPLVNYNSQGRAFRLSIPTPEHFLPLIYVLALKDKDDTITLFNDTTIAGSLAMTSVKIEKE
jgi:4,5-DOPA dioxygenase extradiol